MKETYISKETCNFKEPTNRSHPIQKNSLASCHSVESRALMCHFKQDNLSALSLLS